SSDSSSRSEVKTIVDNLVSNLSNEQKDNLLSQNAYRDKITLHGVNDHPLNPQFPLRRRSTGGNGALELFDLDEPCCSDQSDEDEEDEDENMSCQTDVQFLSQQLPIQQQQLKVRMTGGAGAVAPPSSPQPALNKSDLIAKLSPPTLKNLKQKLLAEQQACAANKTSVTLGAETNEELLKLITAKDNKASLSTIKDTLERLLSHDSLDALGGVGNGTLDVNMPLPFDLDIPQLQQHLSNVNQTAASVTTCVKTDIIDISAPLISAALTTTTTTTAVATTTSGNAAVTNTLSSNTTAQQKNAAAVLQQQQQIVSSNNPAAHSVIKKTLQQQQQLMDVNQQMVQLKQVVEFKRQQQQQQQQQLYRELSAVAAAQEAAADREALANLIQQQQQQQVGEYLRQQQQQQQFVQTELTYVPRAPSPITEEDYSLLRHAKEIVENRAEEFNRYSQIIEKSEYDRLAETVKKVEKRMRDIEKQTISCRKQLADEHERNYREEQKLNKLNKQLKQQLDQANEKVE
uniref:Uncharacterized protein n=1 Tax=Romanomermis culicivorax TaxID=13658 RepID=A0A915IZA3_ROMCU